MTRVAEGLKEHAFGHHIAVVAHRRLRLRQAAGRQGRLHHLLRSSALARECDIAVIMNDKHDAVSRTHLADDTVRAKP